MARNPDIDDEPRSWRDRNEEEAAAEEAARDLRLSLVGLRERIWSVWSRADEEPEDEVSDDAPALGGGRPDERAD